eukprot:GHVS01047130.1.p1 GENE.GHVS01047130.1~~GHVS01047130.1.p1  ORF type:complete len:408 (+),score=35.50 GHVS01047130.1:185-1408(+)
MTWLWCLLVCFIVFQAQQSFSQSNPPSKDKVDQLPEQSTSPLTPSSLSSLVRPALLLSSQALPQSQTISPPIQPSGGRPRPAHYPGHQEGLLRGISFLPPFPILPGYSSDYGKQARNVSKRKKEQCPMMACFEDSHLCSIALLNPKPVELPLHKCTEDAICSLQWALGRETSYGSSCLFNNGFHHCVFAFDVPSNQWQFYGVSPTDYQILQKLGSETRFPYDRSTAPALYSPPGQTTNPTLFVDYIFPGNLFLGDPNNPSFCRLDVDMQSLRLRNPRPSWVPSSDKCQRTRTFQTPYATEFIVGALCDVVYRPVNDNWGLIEGAGDCAVYFVTEIQGQQLSRWVTRCTSSTELEPALDDFWFFRAGPVPFGGSDELWQPGGSSPEFNLVGFEPVPTNCFPKADKKPK